jgi:hypothetical protein
VATKVIDGTIETLTGPISVGINKLGDVFEKIGLSSVKKVTSAVTDFLAHPVEKVTGWVKSLFGNNDTVGPYGTITTLELVDQVVYWCIKQCSGGTPMTMEHLSLAYLRVVGEATDHIRLGPNVPYNSIDYAMAHTLNYFGTTRSTNQSHVCGVLRAPMGIYVRFEDDVSHFNFYTLPYKWQPRLMSVTYLLITLVLGASISKNSR